MIRYCKFSIRHEEFVARKGSPKLIVSDQGSQLIGVIASKEAPESWDWSRIKKENSNSSWEFVPSGSSMILVSDNERPKDEFK